MQRFVTTGEGVRLWTESSGHAEDPPVLLITGANASAPSWPDEFVELLVSRGWRVLRYDHRDTGRSTRVDIIERPYSVADMAGDAVAVLDGHGITGAHVVGFSLGGTLGQVLALDHGPRLRSLALVATAALDVDFVGNMRRALADEPSPDGLPTPTPQIVRAMVSRADPVTDRESALRARVDEWRLLAGEVLPFDAEEFRRLEQRVMDHEGSWQRPGNHAVTTPVPTERGVDLAQVTTPTLVVEGGQGPINPPPHGAALGRCTPPWPVRAGTRHGTRPARQRAPVPRRTSRRALPVVLDRGPLRAGSVTRRGHDSCPVGCGRACG
ncbi:10-carbomethoxy-13-deoxycarminomycin esterase/esterase [Saccharopolyspora lacisalsi]|uniref:10-carbomethoxy-13-deoxycarminomycin esterase/esterase n=1 Tax=Halosaccharopolyspora lacisalsi TaxID=1000566 RepID=A0A839DVB0_9PSEU|nr:alpha/beta fold hydrolase [Halosaccharopolyspora lacisalsi]MBA8824699.1 10-carbomethoxy-13-deoxycarminomycin esterase/esterase [Halosaccharopolyspora lacisalsi]